MMVLIFKRWYVILENLEAHGVAIPSSGTVFLKPNLIIDATARSSITTEPRFVAALIRLLKARSGVRVCGRILDRIHSHASRFQSWWDGYGRQKKPEDTGKY